MGVAEYTQILWRDILLVVDILGLWDYNTHMFNALEVAHMQAATVNYVPNSQKEWTVLLDYVENNSGKILKRKTKEYVAETLVCAEIMSQHYKINPPQLRVKVCPWKQLGVTETIKAIARKYNVPAYMVTGDVHNALAY